MTDYKMILFSEDTKKYNQVTNILNKTFNDMSLISHIDELAKELQESENYYNIILIDDTCVENIDLSFGKTLKGDNYLCILLTEDLNYLNTRTYIFDILFYKNINMINNFTQRLKSYIEAGVKLRYAQNSMVKFYDIGRKLTCEKSINKLLELILKYSMELTQADAASMYIIIDNDLGEWSYYEKNASDRLLKFIVSKNNTIEVELQSRTSSILKSSIAGSTVILGDPINIEDAYDISSECAYSFDKSFDIETGYRTKSILSIPMKDRENRVIGVLQLLNKRTINEDIPFSLEDEKIICSLAGQAAVAVENTILYNNLNDSLSKYKSTISEIIVQRKNSNDEINKLLFTIKNCPLSIVIFDNEGIIQYVNPRFERLTRYEYNEVIGKDFMILKSEHHPDYYYNTLWDTISSGNDWSAELYITGKNGKSIFARNYIYPIKDSSNLIKNYVLYNEVIEEKR